MVMKQFCDQCDKELPQERFLVVHSYTENSDMLNGENEKDFYNEKDYCSKSCLISSINNSK